MIEHNQFMEDISQNQYEDSCIRIRVLDQGIKEPFGVLSQKGQSPRYEQSQNQSLKSSPKKSKKIYDQDQKQEDANNKEKTIKKEPKSRQRKPKRIKDNGIPSKIGRPGNQKVEERHLIENKSYNDIVFHLSRFLIFLKIRQKAERKANYFIPFKQNSKEQEWFLRMDKIMSQDNFPAYQSPKPDFLLHPNSPHYIFKYLKNNEEEKSLYSGQQIKLIMFAFLTKKRLLSENIYNYINDYWRNTINLIHNPNGGNAIQNEPQDEQLNVQQVQQKDLQPVEKEKEISPQKQATNRRKKSDKKEKNDENELQMMKMELQRDQTIIAYQLACYLHACCQKFNLRIEV